MAFTTIPNIRLWNAHSGKHEFTTVCVLFLLLLSLFCSFLEKEQVYILCGSFRLGMSAVIRPLRVPWRCSAWLEAFCKLPVESWCVFMCVPVCYRCTVFGRKSRDKEGLGKVCRMILELLNLLIDSRLYISENLKVWRKHGVSLAKT